MKYKTLEYASKIGKDQILLSLYESITDNAPGRTEIKTDQNIREFEKDSGYDGCVLIPLINAPDHWCFRAFILGHAFRVNGYKPILLWNDGELLRRLEISADDEHPNIKDAMVKRRVSRYSDSFGIDTLAISKVLDSTCEPPSVDNTDLNEETSLLYKDVDISKPAAASMRKYLRRYSLNLSSSENRRTLYATFLRTGMQIVDAILNLIEIYDIKSTIVHEPNYVHGRIPLKTSEKNGIEAYSNAVGYHKGQWFFGQASNRNSLPYFADRELTSQAINTELSYREGETINKIMNDRASGNITNLQHSATTSQSVSVTEDYVVGVFSHLLWDGALEPEQAVYENFYEWLNDTIKTGSEIKDVHFIIKAHPAESLRGTNESVLDWIKENYPDLPNNFTVLSPDTEVNTYELINDLDAGLVYASTVGLEMAFNGVPVVVGGYPSYHGFSITHEPEDKAQYRNYIENITSLKCSDEMQQRAKRFAYFLFVCKHLDCPHLSEYQNKSRSEIQITHDEVANEYSVYRSIVSQILRGEEVIRTECLGLKDAT
jgi:hypothetical protein